MSRRWGPARTGRASTGRRTRPGTPPPGTSTSRSASCGRPGGRCPPGSAKAWPGGPWPGKGLTGEQEDAAVRLLTSTTAASILTAPAGAGKTHTIAAYAGAWTTLTGRRVIGITTAENAARQIAAEGLAKVYNSAAFLGKTPGSDLLRYPVRIGAGDVLVLDESSMISTADLALIMDYADRAGALVVPTGDPFQLGPVEAGGMFPALIRELGAAELSEVLRFSAGWEADASVRLRAGDFSVVAAYDRRGRIRGITGRRPMTAPRGRGWRITCRAGTRCCWPGRTRKQPSLHGGCKPSSWMGTVVKPRTPLATGTRPARGPVPGPAQHQDQCWGLAADQPGRAPHPGLAGPGRGGDSPAARRGLVSVVPVPLSYLARDAELHYAGNIHVARAGPSTPRTCWSPTR